MVLKADVMEALMAENDSKEGDEAAETGLDAADATTLMTVGPVDEGSPVELVVTAEIFTSDNFIIFLPRAEVCLSDTERE